MFNFGGEVKQHYFLKKYSTFAAMFGSILDDIKYEFSKGDTAMRLIFIFIATHLFVWLVEIIAPQIYQGVFIDWVAFKPATAWKIWSWISYAFLHAGFWHLLSNCFLLWWFGSHFITFQKHQVILPIFLFSVLAGAAIHCSASFLIEWIYPGSRLSLIYSPNLPMIGASAGVMGVLWATVAFAPDYEIMLLGRFRIRIKYIALILLITDIISVWAYQNIGGSLAHIAGAYMGYMYVKQLQEGNDLGRFILKEKRQAPKPKSHLKVVQRPTPKEMTLNAILDKINASGMNSLTKKEKAFLDKMGND